MTIKVGDLVYHDCQASRRYAIVHSIDNSIVWGNWRNDKQEALEAPVQKRSNLHIKNVYKVNQSLKNLMGEL